MIYAIVLNWNSAKDTIECVSSLKKIDNIPFKILCVDNASGDNSFDEIKSAHPDIEMIKTRENMGYAGGNNFGIAYAMERSGKYFWILNNDTAVDAGALKPLRGAFNDPAVGAAGSIILYYDKRETVWFAGGKYHKFHGYTSHLYENKQKNALPGRISGIDYVSGCSFMISKNALEKTGLLNESLFHFFEEMDICARLKKAGFKFNMAMDSLVYHKVSQAPVLSPVKMYYHTRNRLYISKKYYPLFLPFVLLWYMRWPFLPAVFKNRENLPFVKKALADFFAGKMGQYNEK